MLYLEDKSITIKCSTTSDQWGIILKENDMMIDGISVGPLRWNVINAIPPRWLMPGQEDGGVAKLVSASMVSAIGTEMFFGMLQSSSKSFVKSIW